MLPVPTRARASRAALRPHSLPLPPLQSTRLLDQVRERIRYLHYSRRTEEVYVQWCRTYIRFHGMRHPAQMGGPEVEAFLSSLATERQVSASTHSQALSALLFLYTKVLCQPFQALQIVWPDPDGCFFYESGYDRSYDAMQPIIGRWPLA